MFVASFAALAGGIAVGQGHDKPPFDIDEAHKLAESYYYHLFFEERARQHPDWLNDFFARTNPPVAKYVFGAVLAATGQHVHDRHLQADLAAGLWRTPDLTRQEVPDAMLPVTRRVGAA